MIIIIKIKNYEAKSAAAVEERREVERPAAGAASNLT